MTSRPDNWSRHLVQLFVLACLLTFAYTTYDLISTHHQAGRHILAVAKEETRRNAAQLSAELRRVEQLGRELSREFAASSPAPKRLEARLHEVVRRHPRIYGVAIGYLPDRHPQVEGLYAPYVIRQGESRKLVRIETFYDYAATPHAWFQQPLQKGPGWVPVYWGDAGQSMMATFATPVLDRQGESQAVVVVDLALNDIWNLINGLDFGSSSYGFIVDSDGKLIAHPVRERVLNKQHIGRLSANDDGVDAESARRALRSGQTTVLQQHNSVTGQPSITVLVPIQETGWLMGATFVRQEMKLAHHDALRLWLHFVASAVALVVALALGYLAVCRAPLARRIHRAALACGLAMSLGVAALWGLQYFMGIDSPYHDRILDGQASVQNYQNELIQANRDNHLPAPRFVPTGVLLRALKMTDVNEVRATGILWQSYPPDTPAEAQRFWFPDALSTHLEEIYRLRQNGREIVGWAFDVALRQAFDNRAYPFDDIAVRLRIRPRQIFSQAIYVPDLAAYDIVIPSAKPFVASNITIPGWKVVQTYFRPQAHGYGMDYGLHGSAVNSRVRDLVLVTTLQRNLMDNFVSVIIPVLVLILLAYGSIRMISGDPAKVKIYDFKPMRMLLVGTSFCLFLILATINLRNCVASDEVIYIEQLYFLLYFIAFGNVFLGMKIATRSGGLLAHDDGRLVKAFYFPVVIGIIFLITFFAFHR